MRSYFCSKCQVAWPMTIPFRHCPGCRAELPPSEHEPLDRDLADDVAAHLIAEREMDDALVDIFRRELDAARL